MWYVVCGGTGRARHTLLVQTRPNDPSDRYTEKRNAKTEPLKEHGHGTSRKSEVSEVVCGEEDKRTMACAQRTANPAVPYTLYIGHAQFAHEI